MTSKKKVAQEKGSTCRLGTKARYSRVPRLSDSPYSAKGTKGKWKY